MRVKNFVLPLVAFCLVACMLVTSCSKDGGGSDGATGTVTPVPSERDEKVVGKWAVEGTNVVYKEYKNDGTYTDNSGTFKWGTSGNKIYYNGSAAGQSVTFFVPYTVDNTKLTLDYSKLEYPDNPAANETGRAVFGNATITFIKYTEGGSSGASTSESSEKTGDGESSSS